MEVEEWMEEFARTAHALYPDNVSMVGLIIAMERSRISGGVRRAGVIRLAAIARCLARHRCNHAGAASAGKDGPYR